jgi:hypothetical protein
VTEQTSVKIEIIREIYDSLLPAFYRLNSLLEDNISGSLPLSAADKAALMDYAACASALKVLFEDYFKQSEDFGANEIVMSQPELLSIISMAKTVESSHLTVFGNTGIWSH